MDDRFCNIRDNLPIDNYQRIEKRRVTRYKSFLRNFATLRQIVFLARDFRTGKLWNVRRKRVTDRAFVRRWKAIRVTILRGWKWSWENRHGNFRRVQTLVRFCGMVMTSWRKVQPYRVQITEPKSWKRKEDRSHRNLHSELTGQWQSFKEQSNKTSNKRKKRAKIAS